jgi:hypothetical protein
MTSSSLVWSLLHITTAGQISRYNRFVCPRYNMWKKVCKTNIASYTEPQHYAGLFAAMGTNWRLFNFKLNADLWASYCSHTHFNYFHRDKWQRKFSMTHNNWTCIWIVTSRNKAILHPPLLYVDLFFGLVRSSEFYIILITVCISQPLSLTSCEWVRRFFSWPVTPRQFPSLHPIGRTTI